MCIFTIARVVVKCRSQELDPGVRMPVHTYTLRADLWLRRQDLKELKFRPSTDVHDYQVRLRSAQKFIAKVTHPAY